MVLCSAVLRSFCRRQLNLQSLPSTRWPRRASQWEPHTRTHTPAARVRAPPPHPRPRPQAVEFAAAEARGEAKAECGSPAEGALGDGFVDVISVFVGPSLPFLFGVCARVCVCVCPAPFAPCPGTLWLAPCAPPPASPGVCASRVARSPATRPAACGAFAAASARLRLWGLARTPSLIPATHARVGPPPPQTSKGQPQPPPSQNPTTGNRMLCCCRRSCCWLGPRSLRTAFRA